MKLATTAKILATGLALLILVVDVAANDPIFVKWLVIDDPGDETIRTYWQRAEAGELSPEALVDLGTMLFYRGWPGRCGGLLPPGPRRRSRAVGRMVPHRARQTLQRRPLRGAIGLQEVPQAAERSRLGQLLSWSPRGADRRPEVGDGALREGIPARSRSRRSEDQPRDPLIEAPARRPGPALRSRAFREFDADACPRAGNHAPGAEAVQTRAPTEPDTGAHAADRDDSDRESGEGRNPGPGGGGRPQCGHQAVQRSNGIRCGGGRGGRCIGEPLARWRLRHHLSASRCREHPLWFSDPSTRSGRRRFR
jgi:hypothetical protein